MTGPARPDTITLDGTPVAALGLGTWRLSGDACRRTVAAALEMGYRHVDTAQTYRNERDVGAGLRDAAVDPAEVLVTTKLPKDRLDGVAAATDESLRRLGVERIGLLLIHWPADDAANARALEQMFALRDAGKVAHVGVSNFPAAQLRRACEVGPVACDQVEYHPFLGQGVLLAAARELGVAVTAYTPLARGRVAAEPVLREIAQRPQRSPAQVALRWLLDQEQVGAVPKASSREHLGANIDLGFALDDEERRAIDALGRGQRLISPRSGPAWDPER